MNTVLSKLLSVKTVIGVLVALLTALYAECFYEAVRIVQGSEYFGLLASDFVGWQAVRTLLFFLLACAVIVACFKWGRPLLRFVDRYRYLIAAVVLVVCVAFELSGSSIAIWKDQLVSSVDSGTLFGVAREIRGDEFRVFTPFAFSQAHTGYSVISDIIRGTATDVSFVYAQPCWDISTLFRPFLWGYLVLGSAKGLSFFWCARLLAMFLVCYEGAKVLLSNKKALAAVFALICVLSPLTQWWFAINGIAELFIFGFGVMLSVYGAFHVVNMWQKSLCAVALAWCSGCFLLVLYPAWQVPLFYVFAFFTIVAIGKALKESKDAKSKKNVVQSLLFCCAGLLVMGIVVGYIIVSSLDVYSIVTGTVYPGNRFDLGGGGLPVWLSSSVTIFSSLDPNSFEPNVCEGAQIFSLAPAGIILSFAALFYSRKANPVIIAGLVLELVLAWYAFFGFPEILAQITLLNRSLGLRTLLAVGVLDAFLLVYSVAVLRDVFAQSEKSALPTFLTVVLAIAGVAAFLMPVLGVQAYRVLWCAMLACAIAAIILSLMRFITTGSGGALLLSFAFILAVSGLTVNPVQKGADVLLNNEVTSTVAQIVEQDPDALWVTDDAILGQACITAGARTINSLNVYPNLELWGKIFPGEEAKSIYNRYSHIAISVTQGESSLEQLSADTYNTYLNADAFKTLGATYFISRKNLEAESGNGMQFTRVCAVNDTFSVYRISFQE